MTYKPYYMKEVLDNSKKELLTHLKRKASVLKPVPRFLTKKRRKYSAGLTL